MSSVMVSDHFHWTGAKRVQAFWDGDLKLVKKLYATYRKYRQKLPEQETIASDPLNELKLLHADQDDDLAEYAQEVDEFEKGINKSKRASEKWGKRENEKLVEQEKRLKTTQEESGLWSGYSNASGSAIGQGHAKGKYSQQQVAWHPGDHFDTTVDRVAGHWCDLGEVSGKLEFLQAMVLAGEQAIHEYIHFARTELERDFEEA